MKWRIKGKDSVTTSLGSVAESSFFADNLQLSHVRKWRIE